MPKDELEIKTKSATVYITKKPPLKVFYTIARKLKISGTIISATDSMLTLVESRFTTVKNFQDNVVPPWANGLFYILPSLVVWAISIKDWIKRDPNDVAPTTLAEKAMSNAIAALPHTGETLEKHEDEKRQLSIIIQSFQYLGSNLKLDIVLNLLFTFVRELHGLLLFLETFQIATKETNQQLSSISSDIYLTLNVVYGITMMLQKIVREEKARMHAADVCFTTSQVLKAVRVFKKLGKQRHERLENERNAQRNFVSTKSALQMHNHYDEVARDIVIDINDFKQPLLKR